MAGTVCDPEAYGRHVADLFEPCMLPHDLGTAAAFSYARFNGRSLLDNVMDVMLSVLTNSPLGTGIRPDLACFTDRCPYLCGVANR
jgi:hypothetical protein